MIKLFQKGEKSREDLQKWWLEWLFKEEPERPIGPCLSDLEILNYVTGEIHNKQEKARIEAHIFSCPKCLEEAAAWADIDHYLNTRKGKREMKHIGRRLRRIPAELYPNLYLRKRIQLRITSFFRHFVQFQHKHLI